MDSGMISKIQKAKRYAQERERINFVEFEVTFRGDHNSYTVSYDRGQWNCGCRFFAKRGVCSHTMTLERILGVMLIPQEERQSEAEAAGVDVSGLLEDPQLVEGEFEVVEEEAYVVKEDADDSNKD